MSMSNYLRVAGIVPKVFLGQPLKNANEMLKHLKTVETSSIVVFPELCITGYSIGDWFSNTSLLEEVESALALLLENSNDQVWIVGAPLIYNSLLYNCAIIIQNGKILGAIPKMHLPSYREFFENRLFTSGLDYFSEPVLVHSFGQDFLMGELIFDANNIKFGVEICEDMWQNKAPHNDLYEEGAQIVFNLSASTFQVGKAERRKALVENASYLGSGAYFYISSSSSETSSDVLFTSHIIAYEIGEELLYIKEQKEDEIIKEIDIDLEKIGYFRRVLNAKKNKAGGIKKIPYCLRRKNVDCIKRTIDPNPFVIKDEKNLNDVIEVITKALYKRLSHIGIKKIVLGVSGGLDSTLALLMINKCFEDFGLDKSGIIPITMPGLATGERSKNNAIKLCEVLGLKYLEIPILEEVKHHFNLIGKDEKKDVTYENIQARYRTLILMNYANLENAIVCGTGDMSEIALGWSTFNADHMSMYNINGGFPKTCIRGLVEHFKTIYKDASIILQNVIDMPISPELTSSEQLTEDLIGKYEINDFLMYHLFINGASKKRIVRLLMQVFSLDEKIAINYYDNFMQRFCRNQFKRLTGAESVKIFPFSFSPRSDLHFPGDMKYEKEKI